MAPGAACVQCRLPRAAVPGAGLAGDAVIGEARMGRRHRVGPVAQSFRSWRRPVLLSGAIVWRCRAAPCPSSRPETAVGRPRCHFDLDRSLHLNSDPTRPPLSASMPPKSGACTRSGRTRPPTSGLATVSIWPRSRPRCRRPARPRWNLPGRRPPIPPDASLDALSRREIDRLERTFTGTGNGVYEGIEALNTRPSRSAEMVEDDESTAMWSANPPLARETLPCSFGSSASSRASTRPPTLETW